MNLPREYRTTLPGVPVPEALIALADAHRSLASEQPGTWAILQQAAPPEVVRSPEAERIATFILAVLRGYPLPESDLVHGVPFCQRHHQWFSYPLAHRRFRTPLRLTECLMGSNRRP